MNRRFTFALLVSLAAAFATPAHAQDDAKHAITLRHIFEPAPDVFKGMHKARMEECFSHCAFDALTDPEVIDQTYIQSYETDPYTTDDGTFTDDAGVEVYRFHSTKAMQEALSHVAGQSNFLVFTKDVHLIKVWSDSSRNQEQQLSAAREYYESRGATFVALQDDESNITDVTAASSEDQNVIDVAREASAAGVNEAAREAVSRSRHSETTDAELETEFAPPPGLFDEMSTEYFDDCTDNCGFSDVPETDAVKQWYVQVFETESYVVEGENVTDDAGIGVYEFESIEALEEILPQLVGQPNRIYLVRDNILIKIWSDAAKGELQTRHLQRASAFYHQMGAKLFVPEDADVTSIGD